MWLTRRNFNMKPTQNSIRKFNEHFMENIMAIQDVYFRNKLLQGLVKYEPKVWAEAQLDPMEENGKR